MNDEIINYSHPSSSSSSIPRSQSLSSNSNSYTANLGSVTPTRSSSISTIPSSSGGTTTRSEKRLSRKLPPAWTESLENLSKIQPPPIAYQSLNSLLLNKKPNQLELPESIAEIGISPKSKTISLPVPESSTHNMDYTKFGGTDSSRPYVLDVDQINTPQSVPMFDNSIKSARSQSESHAHAFAAQSKSTLKKKSIKSNSISGPSSSSSSSSQSSHDHHLSTSVSTASSSASSPTMGFLKSSSKSSSSRSDILLTPKQGLGRLHLLPRSSIDSSASCSSRSRCGPAGATTWSLFDEIQMEDSLSIHSSPSRRRARRESTKEKKERIKIEKELFDEDTPPNHKMLFEASLLEVIDEHGQRIRFGDLVRGRKTIVIFIRHWYCPLCAEYMNSILAEVSLDALEEANVDLIIIGNGSDKMLNGYRNKAFRCPFKMYTDPTLSLYRSLGLTRQTGDGGDDEDKGDYLVQSAMASTVQTIKRATKMPLKNPGHFTQLGGEFIFDGTLNVTYTHRMTNTRSHAPIRDICEKAGVRLEFIHYEPGLPPPPVHRHSYFGLKPDAHPEFDSQDDIPEVDVWQKERDDTISRMKALKAARRGGPEMLFDARSRVVDNVRIVGEDIEEDEVVLGFSALGIAT